MITSNFHPREIWPKPEDHLPILDRVQIVHLEKLHVFDDTPNKRKASKELPTKPKLARQDALDAFTIQKIMMVEEDHCLICSMSPCTCIEILDV